MTTKLDEQMNTLVPMVVEQSNKGERAYDIYSRLLKEAHKHDHDHDNEKEKKTEAKPTKEKKSPPKASKPKPTAKKVSKK